jgi:hypothetical protein
MVTAIYKNQDYAPWLDIPFFHTQLKSKFGSKLSSETLNSLANTYAITYAMKQRDAHKGLIPKPKSKKEIIIDFLNNIEKYLEDNEDSGTDWLELFVAGHGMDQQHKKNKQIDQELIIEAGQFNDDEYARLATFEYIRTTITDISKQQRLIAQMLQPQQQTMHRVKYQQKRQLHRSWLDRLIDYLIRGINFNTYSYLLGFKKKKKRFITVPSIISGISASIGTIIGIKLFPAYGIGVVASAIIGYFAGLGLYKNIKTVLTNHNSSSQQIIPPEKKSDHQSSLEKTKELSKQQERAQEIEFKQAQEHSKAKKQEEKIDYKLELVKQHMVIREKEKAREQEQEQMKVVSKDKAKREADGGAPSRSSSTYNKAANSVNPLDTLLVEAVKLTLKATTHAVNAMVTPENTPQTNKVARSTHASRVLEGKYSDGGGAAKGK